MILFLIILFGLVLKTSYRKPDFKYKNYTFLFLTIIVIHFCAFLVNHLYIDANDSSTFYQGAVASKDWFSLFGIGTKSMSFIIYPLTQCGFNYFNISLLCAIISLKGYFIYLELISKKLKHPHLQHFFLLFIFISPSIHIWTSSLYKESILFTLMALVLKELHNKKIFNLKLLLIILLITMIRPYIALIIILSIIAVNYKVIIKKHKISSLVLLSTIAIALINFVKVYNLSSFKSHFEKIIYYSSNNGNSSIDLLNSNYMERLFLVLFRPLLYESKSVFQFFVSIENFFFTILLVIFSYKLFKQKPNFILVSKCNRIIMIFSISCILFYSVYMYNLGLASRMRVMFIPYLLIGMFNLLSLKKI